MLTFTAGTQVWVSDPAQGWMQASVIRPEGDQLLVKTPNGAERTVAASSVHLQNTDKEWVEDMTRLAFLHEPGVLWNLNTRFLEDHIYTYTGSILIAVNPFASKQHLYQPAVMQQYQAAEFGSLPPHVYAVASAAYSQMQRDNKGQAILITGESGAGKTETCKLIMKYLAYLGDTLSAQRSGATSRRASAGGNGNGSGSNFNVQDKVLQSNPLLEAFGNAKTVRNDNSSRFGKYVEIAFDASSMICGAAIRTYLLERSRVVAVNDPERCFHIFYQLCDGASAEERKKWQLLPAAQFRYLANSSCFKLKGVDNAEEFAATREAMRHIGLTAEEQDAVFGAVSAVLHLGNVNFVDRGDSSESCDVEPGPSQQSAAAAAQLLGVGLPELLSALTSRTRQTRDGPITSFLTAAAARETRDALAKVVYVRLFDWLVSKINASMGTGFADGVATIGLLDIYGFESFASNDFEQLCINLANEKLQQHFNQFVFKWEQAEYEKEGIDWSYIKFVDNQDVLDLIEGKMGLLELLDETCRFTAATGGDLATKYAGTAAVKDSKRFTKLKRPANGFAVDHYAGAVNYVTDNFLDKNKDYVVGEHQALLQGSSVPLVSALVPAGVELEPAVGSASKGGGSGGPSRAASGGLKGADSFKSFQFSSVSSQFKKQLGELMAKLNAMAPHYVRCIKPNPASAPATFDASYVLNQLKCGGVMEAVRISCAGFPYKRPFAEFVDYYWQVCPAALHDRKLDRRDAAAMVCKSAGVPNFQLGKTKVFLKAGEAALLERVRTDRRSRAASTIGAHWRGWVARRRFQELRRAAVAVQVAVRAAQAKALMRRLRQERGALVVQSLWRTAVARRAYEEKRAAVVHMQACFRARAARREFIDARREWAATRLASVWRMRVVRREFAQQMAVAASAGRIQRWYRRQLVSRRLLVAATQWRAAARIQAAYRNHKNKVHRLNALRTAFLTYIAYHKAALVFQDYWRCKAARLQLEHLQRAKRRQAFRANVSMWENRMSGGADNAAPPKLSPASQPAKARSWVPRATSATPPSVAAVAAAAAITSDAAASRSLSAGGAEPLSPSSGGVAQEPWAPKVIHASALVRADESKPSPNLGMLKQFWEASSVRSGSPSINSSTAASPAKAARVPSIAL